jgi:hypothetical protein
MTQFPDVPTFTELGFDKGALDTWGDLFTAQSRPAALVKTLADEIESSWQLRACSRRCARSATNH